MTLGIAITGASRGVLGVLGFGIADKGVDNIYAGINGETTLTEKALQDITGDDTAASLINAGLDLSTSTLGILRTVPKKHFLGAKKIGFIRKNKSLLRKDKSMQEAAHTQMTKTALQVEAATATGTVADTLKKSMKQNDKE